MNNPNDIKLIRNNTFSSDIVIIDGQGRSGKNMISVILSTMPRVEKMRLDSLFDYVPRYYSIGKMSKDAALMALKIEADEKLYNTMISRSVNFRFDDYTGIFKQGKPFKYIKRLFMKSEQEAVQRIENEKPIFQEMTHDGMHLIDLYFEAFEERLKFIHVFRDPVGNIYEQNKRDFGTRIGTDPREFQLTYNWTDKSIPLNVIGMEEDYINGNPLERLVLQVDSLFRKNIEGFKKLDDKWKKRVFFIEFERFAVDPWPYLDKLEEFLQTNTVSKTRKIMRRENCPRKPDTSQRENRISDINNQLSSRYQKIFKNLIEDYDKRPWKDFNNKS